jgi:hypothetical protein
MHDERRRVQLGHLLADVGRERQLEQLRSEFGTRGRPLKAANDACLVGPPLETNASANIWAPIPRALRTRSTTTCPDSGRQAARRSRRTVRGRYDRPGPDCAA